MTLPADSTGPVRVRFPPSPDRRPARRQRPHARCSTGPSPATTAARFVLAHRGHRPRPQHRGVLPRGARRPALARPGLGRGTRGRRSARPYRQSERLDALRRGRQGAARGRATRTRASAPTRGAGPAGGAAARRPRATTTTTGPSPRPQIAAFRAEGRHRCCASGCPTSRSSSTTSSAARCASSRPTCRTSCSCARDGVPALPAGQPGRRRRHADHPRAARRGPARLHPATDPPARARCGSLGLADGPAPRFGHLPFVLGEGNQKLSKRDARVVPGVTCAPTATCPRACSTTWRCWAGRSAATASCSRWRRWPQAFTLDRVSRNPARFDTQEAHRRSTASRSASCRRRTSGGRLLPFLASAGLVSTPPSPAQLDVVEAAAPLVQERVAKLTEAVELLAFLLVDDASFAVDPAAAEKTLGPAAAPVLDAAVAVLEPLPDWTGADVQEALEGALVDSLGLRPRVAYGPVRVAVTGPHRVAAALRVPRAARSGPDAGAAALRPCRLGVRSRRRLCFGGRCAGQLGAPMGYGVIGSPADSGSASLGSSPGTPAPRERSAGTM